MKLKNEHQIDRLSVSFSGGRTSAVMARLLKEQYMFDKDIVVTFANTGCEHEDTLRFVNDCDRNWGLGVVWLEAVVTQGKRVGIRHKIVTYETASRNGEPFEEYIKKYGIPNAGSPQCTSRLKTEVMESYLKSIGFKRGKGLNYWTAIGIRADECDRVSMKAGEMQFVYPLVEWGFTKQGVIDYMSKYDFDLRIPEHLGNCTWCWKKSLRKHLTLAQDYPEVFNFPAKMEEKYSNIKAKNGERNFFRGNTSTKQILEISKKGGFKRFDDPNYRLLEDWNDDLDRRSSCEDSCEVYPH